MSSFPQPLWACVLAFMGLILALAVLFAPGQDNIKLAVLAVASALVTGALGAFAGHGAANSDTKVTGENATVNQVAPKVTP